MRESESMTENRTKDVEVSVKGLKKFSLLVGGMVATVIGNRGDERARKKKEAVTRRTYSYYKDGDPNKHYFTGTPAEAKKFFDKLNKEKGAKPWKAH
jgi:hypothetical protein